MTLSRCPRRHSRQTWGNCTPRPPIKGPKRERRILGYVLALNWWLVEAAEYYTENNNPDLARTSYEYLAQCPASSKVPFVEALKIYIQIRNSSSLLTPMFSKGKCKPAPTPSSTPPPQDPSEKQNPGSILGPAMTTDRQRDGGTLDARTVLSAPERMQS